jgi:diacylglycerol kinase (ATP)
VPEPAFIVNPTAGRSRAERQVGWLRSAIRKTWPGSVIRISTHPGDAARIGREESAMGRTVIACGGDGTVNELVGGLAGTDAVLGVLPLGTGNDFAKSVGMGTDRETALRRLASARVSPLDLIRYATDARSGWCGNTLGIGFDGWANTHAQGIPRLTGTLRYLVATLKTAFTFRAVPMRLELDGTVVEGRFLMCVLCNGTTEGGNFRVAPMADNADGWMDVVLIADVSVPKLLFRLPFFLFGNPFRFRDVTHHRCRRAGISIGVPVAVHVDGERIPGDAVTRVDAEVVPGALRVLRV